MVVIKHGAQQTKRQKTAAQNQNMAIEVALADDDAYFGRVLKINMGRCTVKMWDHTTRRHLEIQAILPNKKKGFIKMNDIVNLARSHPDWEVIIALSGSAVNELSKAGRITPEVEMNTSGAGGVADAGFEFDYEPNATTEPTSTITSKKDKVSHRIDALHEDIDIDAI